MPAQSGMYADTRTWNPFKGCKCDCVYCGPSFQRQAKRQKQICKKCCSYKPHPHPDRLPKIPSADIIFVCGNGDISFADPKYVRQIIERIKEHNERAPHKVFYFQSKRPEYFKQFLSDFPDNVILVTTLETNRNKGYRKVSKAPLPTARYKQFLDLDYPRKVVTIEPVMDFDHDVFLRWLKTLKPEYVWIAYDSHPEAVDYPEPEKKKVRALIATVRKAKIKVKTKDMR